MKESLEPHVYWVQPDRNQEYSPDPEFKMPLQLDYPMCIVHWKRGVLALDFMCHKKFYIIIIFNAEEMDTHEALIFASRILPGEALMYSDQGCINNMQACKCIYFTMKMKSELVVEASKNSSRRNPCWFQ